MYEKIAGGCGFSGQCGLREIFLNNCSDFVYDLVYFTFSVWKMV